MITVEIKPCNSVDFGRLIRDVLARGEFNRNAICLHASMPRSSLFNYENGSTPSHPIGERLIDMWCSQFNLPRERVPTHREPRPSSHSAFPSMEKAHVTR